MEITRIAVVDGGVMGNGIAQMVAASGFDVTVVDVSDGALAKSLRRIRAPARA